MKSLLYNLLMVPVLFLLWPLYILQHIDDGQLGMMVAIGGQFVWVIFLGILAGYYIGG